MRHSVPRRLVERLLRAVKRFCKRPQRPSVFDEMMRGSAIGLPASACIAAGIGLSEAAILGAGLLGIGVGALIGLLLWIGADGLPEDPVVPAGRARQERSEVRQRPPP